MENSENQEAEAGKNGDSPPEDETAMETVMQGEKFPHLLEMIAKKMEVEDLWILRQTCPIWNKEFIPALRDKEEAITLVCDRNDVITPEEAAATNNDTSSESLLSNTSISASKRSLQSYTEVMRSSKSIPIAKYTLVDVNAKNTRPEELAEFFKVCGPSITHLNLWVGRSYKPTHEEFMNPTSETVDSVDIVSLKQILFHQVPNMEDLLLVVPYFKSNQPVQEKKSDTASRDLPKLRKLAFHIKAKTGEISETVAEAEDGDIHPVYRSLVADLLRHATGLHTIELGNDDGSHLVPIKLLRDEMTEESLAKLKTLKIYMLNVPDLEVLLNLSGGDGRKKPLRLETLHTSIGCESDRFVDITQPFYRFLESQSNTLRQVSLATSVFNHYDITPPVPITSLLAFPVMPGVHTLCLARVMYWISELAHPLELSFPNLVKYEYFNNLFEIIRHKGDSMRGFGYSGLGVTDLTLYSLYVGKEDFKNTCGSRFQLQLITRLEIRISMNAITIFQEICASMQALEELSIKWGVIWKERGALKLDHILAGVPQDRLGQLKQFLDIHAQPGSITLTALQNLLHQYKTEPSLQDLRSLKKFVLFVSNPSHGYHLTDVGAYFGFACASKTLQHISIQTGTETVVGNTTTTTKDRVGPASQSQVGYLSKCRYAANLVSVQCEEMIRSIMSLPAVLCFY